MIRTIGDQVVDDFQLLIDLHKDAVRQGPGGDDETRHSVILSGLKGVSDLNGLLPKCR